MNTDNIDEEVEENTVVYMGDFLARRRNKLVTSANELYEKAVKLSKHPDPRQDPFATVLMKKVESASVEVDKIESHMRFIARGGNTVVSIAQNSAGYSLNVATLPAVNIHIGDNPTE